ncbi:MAG: septal ring lytic transglycosylase RlpA family protein [Candidatus Acidiferrales bacterium]
MRSRSLVQQLGVAALLAALALGVGGCRKKAAAAPRPSPAPPAAPGSYVEDGLASWYGHPYHGRLTANGETYDMNQMTAAHRTLAFNSWVKVINLENNRTTRVRINDRGPFIEGRIIDLSRVAADEIAMLGPGTAPVRIEVVEGPPGSPPPARYGVQVGAFKIVGNAQRLRDLLGESFKDSEVVAYDAPDGIYYRVRVGRVPTIEEAQELARKLRHEPDVVATFVVRLN